MFDAHQPGRIAHPVPAEPEIEMFAAAVAPGDHRDGRRKLAIFVFQVGERLAPSFAIDVDHEQAGRLAGGERDVQVANPAPPSVNPMNVGRGIETAASTGRRLPPDLTGENRQPARLIF